MEIKWINCAKCVAIIAVLVDHTRKVLYRSNAIWTLSFYSVALFIILSGMTSYISEKGREGNYWSTFVRSGKKIFIDYCIATAIYQIVMYQYFDLETYFRYIISFNISGPFYFVCLYLQLMFVKKLLYMEIENSSIKRDICCFIIVSVISVILTEFTNVFNIYGGGGKLLGGTYLSLFFAGMLMMKYNICQIISSKGHCLRTFVLSGGGYLALWRCIYIGIETGKQRRYNPPELLLSIMSFSMLGICFSFFSWMEERGFFTKGITAISFLGKHSLYIFLFHRLFLDYICKPYIQVDNIWIKRGAYFTIMIIGPIGIEKIIKRMKQKTNSILMEVG